MAKLEIQNFTPIATQNEDGEAQKPRNDVDDAKTFLDDREQISWTDEEERRLVRKIDMRLVPLMFFAGLLEYMDSQGFGIAALFGMIQNLELYTIVSINPLITSTNKYSWCVSIPAFGSVVSQYPLLAVIQYLPLGKVAGVIIVYSGFFALMMIIVNDFASTMIVRFFYGFQVVGTPVNLLLTPMWWKSSEQPLRIAIRFAGAPVGSLFGQVFNYGVIHLKGKYEDSPWRWIYVVVGSFSLAFSVIFLILFPDSPMKAKFLNDRDRQIAVQRLQGNNTGIQTPKFKLEQVWETLVDPQLYLITTILFTVAFANQAFGSFSGLLLSNFGWPTFHAIKLLMPASVIIILSMLISGLISQHFPNHRILNAMLFFLPPIAGNALMWKLPRDDRYGILAGLYISITFYGSYIQVLSLITSNVAGYTKKITFHAIVSTFAYVGAIASPFAFKGQEAAQGYPTGMSTVLGLIVVGEICLLLLWLHYKRMNSRNEDLLRESPPSSSQTELAFQDLSDFKNPYFVYKL